MSVAAIEAQVKAARPTESSWVSANAGSGKTRVLTDRVARLLLAGTAPERILCLTYTKAAAAEMQNRLFQTLGRWAMLDDADLRAALGKLGEEAAAIPEGQLGRARTLFARALETPGGLKIQTIHAFCEALLRRFPLEAGVAPRFEVLDDRQARALRETVLDGLAEREPAVFAGLARHLSGDDPDPLLGEISRHREAFAGPFDEAALARALGVEGVSLDRFVTPADMALLGGLAPLLAAGGASDRNAAERIAAALAETDAGRRLEQLEAGFLTAEGTVRKTLPTKAVRSAHPGLMPPFDALAARVQAARAARVGLAALDKSAALNRFGRAWLAAYAARKRAGGVLDFDDMIERARMLLEQPGTAAWVLWRLDGGLDHLLVDEAQDTSPAQWRVIEAVSSEFFAGEGARESRRTIFVVGDDKQSIYSFQGADPGAFAAKAVQYARALADVGSALQACDLLYSFRSSAPVLALVDAVFRGPAGEDFTGAPQHHAFDPEKPGRVEVWPFLPKPDKPDESPWHEPAAMPAPVDPVEQLAGAIAARIRGWLDEGRALPGEGRAIRAGDVMILVQRRNAIFHAVIRALKRAGVPVAGADLLKIGGELAVKDLLAALRVGATPGDDLSLAAFLRGPLGGLAERELFELAHARRGRLWDRLAVAHAGRWPEARALLDEVMTGADYLRPYDLIQRMLVRHRGRQRLVARLGREAEDGIDALVDQALAYESVEAPTLTGFLAWIDQGEVTVKRRSEEGVDQVRVMTVHGAKGLEAPIVFLPDTAARQEGGPQVNVLRLGAALAGWRAKAAEAPEALAAAETARRELVKAENRRLLYVALTRPKSWLVVCGAGAENANGDSWHALVEGAMRAMGATEEEGPLGPVLSIGHRWTEATGAAVGAEAETEAEAEALPDWTRRPLPAAPGAARLVSPSLLGGASVLDGFAAEDDGGLAAVERGTAIHRLLEHLRGRPVADRPALAARLLPGIDDPAALLAEAEAVLDAPGLGFLFGPDSMAEVAVAAPLAALGGARILGRIDRLVVTPARVLAVDFKSNRLVPGDPASVPEAILRQLGAYRAALAPLWPGRAVETAVLWTHGPRLMPVPDALVDAALYRAGRDPAGLAPAGLDPDGGRS